MSDDEESDDMGWAAERRNFVADWRDGIAAERDGHADVERRRRTNTNDAPTIAKLTSTSGSNG